MANFLTANGWGGVTITPLAGDASFRRYFRLVKGDRRAVLMDAAAPQEDVRPFAVMARNLRSIDLHAPEVLAEDLENGLLLLEDLGDDTYTRVLAEGGDEKKLYKLAVDVLIHIHRFLPQRSVPEGFTPYGDEKLLEETLLLTDWYMPAMLGAPTPEEVREEFRQAWLSVFPLVHAQPQVLVLKDYHADNLMWLPENDSLKACGLLDFQDAVSGPGVYDLMSLLEDARRDIDPKLAKDMQTHYRLAFPGMDWDAFMAAYAIVAAQRHAKVIGIFTRLCVRDSKPGYLVHIPRVWRLLEQAAAHPALAQVADWLERRIPKDKRNIPQCP